MKFVALVLLALSTALTAGSAGASEANPETLKVALLPDENASTVIKNNQPLKDYLEQRLGKKIELVVTTDYSSMIEAARFERIDLAYFGPLSYTLARSKAKIEAFAALLKNGRTTYQSVLIGNIAAGIASVADIRGHHMAFGDAASTSSHLIPKMMLLRADMKAGEAYDAHFVGSHDAVAVAVQNGTAQAGGLSRPIFESLVERGIISLQKVRVLETSEPFPEYPWSMRSDLDPSLKEQIRTAFYEMTDPAVLKPFKADGFAPVNDKAYDVVRELETILNLDLTH